MHACSLSAVIDNSVFAVHGGLSPTITTLDQVSAQSRMHMHRLTACTGSKMTRGRAHAA